MNFWTNLNNYWAKSFYSEPLMFLLIILSIIISITHFKKTFFHKVFAIYSATCFIIFLLYILFHFQINLSIASKHVVYEIDNNLFELLEIYIFLKYFSHCIDNRKTYKWAAICFRCYTIIILFFLLSFSFGQIKIEKISEISFLVNDLELIIILLFCISYFINLFKKDPIHKLTSSPSFWIASGILFYTSISIPLFLIAIKIKTTNETIYNLLISGHYITLGLLFLSITRAYLCKKPLTT